MAAQQGSQQSWPRPQLVYETQSTLVHGQRAPDFVEAGLVLTGSAGSLHPVSRHVRLGAVVEGRPSPGTIGQANGLQLLVNQEARATTGCFRTTNLGALTMESGLMPAAAQLENR